MRPKLLDFQDLTDRDLGAWRELAAAAVEPNPFYEPDFVLPGVAHLKPRGVKLLVVPGEDGWLACLPVQRSLRPVPNIRAWLHTHSYSSTPLLHADALSTATGGLLDVLLGRRLATVAWFSAFPGGNPAFQAVRDTLADREIEPIHVHRTARAALLPRGPNDDGTLLSSKERSELRRKLRRLGEQVGAEPEFHDRAGDEGAITRLIDLEHAGWKAETGSSVLSHPGRVAFFREVCRRFSEQGRLILLELSSGDRALAMTSALRAGDGVFGFTVGDDHGLRKFSPGIQVQVALGERILAESPRAWVDSCSAPNNETQNRLWPHQRQLVQLLLPTRSPLSPLAAAAARKRLGEHAPPRPGGASQVATARSAG